MYVQNEFKRLHLVGYKVNTFHPVFDPTTDRCPPFLHGIFLSTRMWTSWENLGIYFASSRLVNVSFSPTISIVNNFPIEFVHKLLIYSERVLLSTISIELVCVCWYQLVRLVYTLYSQFVQFFFFSFFFLFTCLASATKLLSNM